MSFPRCFAADVIPSLFCDGSDSLTIHHIILSLINKRRKQHMNDIRVHSTFFLSLFTFKLQPTCFTEHNENRARPMAQNKNHNQTQTSLPDSPFTEPIRCIVKLGGAAITCKNELEMINEEILQKVSEQLRQVMVASPEKPPGMDWSKRPGDSEIFCNPEEFGDHSDLECSRFIVVHGAG